jgi:hypothetical protein
LESHAAERTSLLSWLDMMAERFHVLSYKILWKDYYTLEEKYLLIRRLEDVAITASYVDSCQETLYIEDLYNTIEEIRRKEVDEEFRTEVPLYFSYLFEAQEYVLNECSWEADW